MEAFFSVNDTVMEVEGTLQTSGGHLGDASHLDTGASPVVGCHRPAARTVPGHALLPCLDHPYRLARTSFWHKSAETVARAYPEVITSVPHI